MPTALLRALCLLLALASPAAWPQAQPAGRVLLAVGEVAAERGGQRVPLTFNAQVFAGDTIRLGPASNAQIRMTDQSVIALRERTGFRIDEYQFEGGEGRSVFSLLAGGMRTVTGAIGRLQPQRGNYAVKTPTSTIGIRGTHFTLVHCNNDCGTAGTASALLAAASTTASDAGPLAQAGSGGTPVANGTYGGVTDGRINATPLSAPQLGQDFGHDEYFYVANASTAPQSLLAPPSFLHDRLSGQSRTQGQKGTESGETLSQGGINGESRPSSVPEGPKPSTFVVTEQKTSTGQSTVVSSTPTHGGLVAFRGADGKMSGGGAFITPSMVTVTGSGTSQAVASLNIPAGTITTDGTMAAPGAVGTLTGSVTDLFVGSSVEILMGRWTSGTLTDDVGASTLQGGLHFVYGPLTPPDVISAKTGTFNFFTVAQTTPTHSTFGTGSGSFASTLSVNFTNRTVSVPGVSLSFGSQFWSLPTSTGTIKIVPGVGASFDTGNVNGGSCSGGGCTGTVSVQASGIFMGPATTSQHLGVVFGATNNASQTLQGAKVYQCSGC